ncbi:MAG: hypothetical protein U5J96_11085 [Ignavibacteriaceae bacterium]|nr:hypothetical protein [Ignavibacteriaceae bacterium]
MIDNERQNYTTRTSNQGNDKNNGGYATLGFLYHNVDVSGWGTKTPLGTINRIVQDKRFFFRIKPGLWALKNMRDIVLRKFSIQEGKEKKEEFNHSYYQGLLVEVGNIRGFQTYIPNQNRKRIFLNESFGEISTLKTIYNFSYDDFIRRARMVDVIWFNDRKMPSSFFEVEHSTDINNSLIKFSQLKDFYSGLCIVADIYRKREFEGKVSANVF